MAASRFSGEDYERARAQNETLEVAMRSILKLFADGCLVYRKRETTVRHDIGSSSHRVRRLRSQGAPSTPVPAIAT
jgi:hypothetical protein